MISLASIAVCCSLSHSSQRLDHHLLLATVGNKQAATVKHKTHGVHNAVEAAGSTTLLREANDTHLASLAVLNHRHHLSSNGHLLNVQVCSIG